MSAVVLSGGHVLGSGQLVFGVPTTSFTSKILGTNIGAGGGGSLSSEDLPIFVNQYRAGDGARTGFGSGTYIPVTASGWPDGTTSTFYCLLWQGSVTQTWMQQTIYCGYQSTGSETVSSAGSGTLTTTGTNGNGYKTFHITGAGANCGFEFTNVTTPITNIYASITGSDPGLIDDPTTVAAYTSGFKSYYGQFNHIRWMQASNMEYCTAQQTSSTMHTPSNTQSNQGWFASTSQEGYPIAWFCAACVAAGVGLWANFPVYEDGTNGGAGSWTTAALSTIASTVIAAGLPVVIEISNELWNTGTYPVGGTLATLASAAGLSTAQYLGYRYHQLAQACRANATISSVFGSSVRLAMCWQPIASGGVGGFYTPINYISSTYYSGGVQSDVAYLGSSNYVTQSSLGDLDSVVTIESKMTSAANTYPTSSVNMESQAALALWNGAQACTYESNLFLANPVGSPVNNLSAAILDSGWAAVVEAEKTSVLNAGAVIDTHFYSGVASSSSAGEPGWALTYTYSSLSTSPAVLGLQNILAGLTPTRNVVSGSGSVVSGGNYLDTISGSSPEFSSAIANVPFNSSNYIGWLIYCTSPKAYSLVVNTTGTATTNVGIANYPNGGSTVYTAKSLSSGNTTIGNVTLINGWNLVLLGNGSSQGSTTVNSLTFN